MVSCLVYHPSDLLNGALRTAPTRSLPQLAPFVVDEDSKRGAFDVKGSVS
ncbi:hypothetical protein FHR32_001943 [Streptosporangium album]|uniref:Uncharacterized protein n=1 Tax=Streptosporangium album TaxID=47479 RepID=A0A7W7RSZ1_9ACTN|nr:hypothetical protein [Streptosporangium album]